MPGHSDAARRHGLSATLARLDELADPADRAAAAGDLLAALGSALVTAKQIRRAAVAELRERGATHAEIAAELGISRGRSAQLAAGVARSRPHARTSADR